MVTIKDVANKAGVSISTVSYVINHKKKVKPQTEEKIFNAIKELNYSPNLTARSLKTKRTNSIGVIVPDISNMFFTEIIKGIEDTASKENYVIILCSTYENAEKEEKELKTLIDKDVDGLIFISTGKTQISDIHKKVPIVLVDRKLGSSYLSVMLNNKKGGFLATDYLLSKRNAEVFLFTGPLTINTYFERMSGYLEALEKHGYSYNERSIINCEVSYSGGIKAFENFAYKNEIKSIFAANDLIALGLIKSILQSGLKIPDDIMIVGFDDIPTSSIINPSLTTIRQPTYFMGLKAAELIFNKLNDNPIEEKHIILEPELIVRDSA